METSAVQLLAQQVPEARVTAGHKHILVIDILNLQTVPVQPHKDPKDHEGASEIQPCILPVAEQREYENENVDIQFRYIAVSKKFLLYDKIHNLFYIQVYQIVIKKKKITN